MTVIPVGGRTLGYSPGEDTFLDINLTFLRGYFLLFWPFLSSVYVQERHFEQCCQKV